MCRFASFFHNPLTSEVVVHDLKSHGNTEQALKLNLKIWREGHYLPNGEIELRLEAGDRVDKVEYCNSFHGRFPTFISFLNWAFEKICKDEKYGGSLYLSDNVKQELKERAV